MSKITLSKSNLPPTSSTPPTSTPPFICYPLHIRGPTPPHCYNPDPCQGIGSPGRRSCCIRTSPPHRPESLPVVSIPTATEVPVTTSSPPVARPSSHSGTHPQHRGMLDVPALEAVVQRLYGHGLSQNSTRTYDSASRRFLWFCDIAGLSPLPLTERTLCLYVASLSQDRIQPSSICTYLSSLRHLKSQLVSQIHTRFPRLSYVLRGIKRQNPSNPDNRLPITPDILQSLWQQWAVPPVSYDARLLWAAACLAFFGFFRTDEFTTNSQHTIPEGIIAATDVTRATDYPPAFVRVRLMRSKTDPYGNELPREDTTLRLSGFRNPLLHGSQTTPPHRASVSLSRSYHPDEEPLRPGSQKSPLK